MCADARGRPPVPPEETLARIHDLVTTAEALQVKNTPPRPLLLGRHLVSLGYKPGPAFKPLLDAAFEAQLDGAFNDEPAAMTWLRSRLLETNGELR